MLNGDATSEAAANVCIKCRCKYFVPSFSIGATGFFYPAKPTIRYDYTVIHEFLRIFTSLHSIATSSAKIDEPLQQSKML